MRLPNFSAEWSLPSTRLEKEPCIVPQEFEGPLETHLIIGKRLPPPILLLPLAPDLYGGGSGGGGSFGGGAGGSGSGSGGTSFESELGSDPGKKKREEQREREDSLERRCPRGFDERDCKLIECTHNCSETYKNERDPRLKACNIKCAQEAGYL
jgi:hypothetical protein